MNASDTRDGHDVVPHRYRPPPDLAARLTNVDLNLLPALLALLQESGVTAAGHQLGLSQPAMSHALSRLRLLLGDQLLVRSGNRSHLTPRARALEGALIELLSQVSDLVLGAPAAKRQGRHAEIVVSMAPWISAATARLVSEAVAECCPGGRIRILESTSTGDLFADPFIDIALVDDGVATPHERIRLFSDRWAGVISADNHEVGEQLTVDDLARLPHVGLQERPAHGLDAVLTSVGASARYDASGTNPMLIPALVVGTERIAIIPRRAALEFTRHFPLRILDLPFASPVLNTYAVLNPRSADVTIPEIVETLHGAILAFAT